jgi:hypothetical protein
MTWRWRLATWLLKPTPEWIVVPTDSWAKYIRILAEEAAVRRYLKAHPHLVPTFEALRPSKKARLH